MNLFSAHIFSTAGAPPADVFSIRSLPVWLQRAGLYLGLTISPRKIGAVSTCTCSCTGIMIVAQKVHATAVAAQVDGTSVQLYARAKPVRCAGTRNIYICWRDCVTCWISCTNRVQAISYLVPTNGGTRTTVNTSTAVSAVGTSYLELIGSLVSRRHDTS